MRKFILASLAITAIMGAAQAKNPADDVFGKVLFTSAGWEVRVKADRMTDKKTCTIVLKDRYSIQATESRLMLSFKGRGGVKGYEIRIDDRPMSGMRVASGMERDVSAVILEDEDFAEIVASKRLRVQVVPVLSGLLFEDVPAVGLAGAVGYVKQNCA